RSVVQIPGMSVSLNTQVQVVEQLRTMDVQLGDLMSQYYDGAVPPNNTIEALSSAESRVDAIDQQLDAYEAELNAGQNQINQQRAELEAAETEIANGQAALEEAQNQLYQETENGQAELEEARLELEQ